MVVIGLSGSLAALIGNQPTPALLTETSPPEPPTEKDHLRSESIEMQPMLKYAATFGGHELHTRACMQSGANKSTYAGMHCTHAQVTWCRPADSVHCADYRSGRSPEQSRTRYS